jgi:hypothetical protein
MSSGRGHPARLLRWYPAAWRDRYGDELVALIEDMSDGHPVSRRTRATIAWAGMCEHGHQVGVLGRTRNPWERLRAGALVVLCAWSAFVIAGASFQKMAEHFPPVLAAGPRNAATIPYDVLQTLATVGACLVILGAVVALPAFVRLLRAGGWAGIRRPVGRAVAATVVVGLAVVPLALWAQHLTPGQRNGRDVVYSLAFVAWGLGAAGVVALWTAAVVTTVRRLSLAPAALLVEALLAGALATAMIVMTLAAAAWWAVVATYAPWFLHGTAPGTPGSAFNLQAVTTVALMAVAAAVALFGMARLRTSWADTRAA